MLADAEIARLATTGEVEVSVGALIDAANAAGGYDNISVVIAALA